MSATLPRICFVALNAFPMLSDDESIPLIGGAELQQAFVAKELVKRGFSVTMICLDFGQKKRVEIDGVEVIRAYNASDGIPILRYVSCSNAARCSVHKSCM